MIFVPLWWPQQWGELLLSGEPARPLTGKEAVVLFAAGLLLIAPGTFLMTTILLGLPLP